MKLSESKYKGQFLKADDLSDEVVIVTVAYYAVEDIQGNEEGKTADALYFTEFKRPLNLNKTNTAMMVDLFGDETDDWKGKLVRLVKAEATNPQTKAKMETIRIRPYEKKPSKKV